MIRRITEYEPLLEQWSKAAGCLPVRLAAAWECYGGHAPDCAFYAVDDAAVLMVHGAGALLCGEVSDLAEIHMFLSMSGALTLLGAKPMQGAQKRQGGREVVQADQTGPQSGTAAVLKQRLALQQVAEAGEVQEKDIDAHAERSQAAGLVDG